MGVNKKGDLSSLLQYRREQNNPQKNAPPSSADESFSSEQLKSEPTSQISESIEKSSSPNTNSSSEPNKVGRPPGRRSNPDTENTTLILNKKLKAEVLYKLSLENIERTPGHKTSLSDLVEQLLSEWNKSN